MSSFHQIFDKLPTESNIIASEEKNRRGLHNFMSSSLKKQTKICVVSWFDFSSS